MVKRREWVGEPRAGFCSFCLKLAFSISTHFHLPDLDKQPFWVQWSQQWGGGSNLPPEDCITSHNIRHDFNEVGNYLLLEKSNQYFERYYNLPTLWKSKSFVIFFIQDWNNIYLKPAVLLEMCTVLKVKTWVIQIHLCSYRAHR